MTIELDLTGQNLVSGLFVEASAGTGKTYSVAALIVRELALRDELRIANVLVTTFTRNAASELQDRIRRRLIDSVERLTAARDKSVEEIMADIGQVDAVDVLLVSGTPAERGDRIARLKRAIAEYDSATIGTIHAVFNKILMLAGETTDALREDEWTALVDEAVNDALLSRADVAPLIPEVRFRTVIKQCLAEPMNDLWFDVDNHDAHEIETLGGIKTLIEQCLRSIKTRSRGKASFDYLIRRAREIAEDSDRIALIEEFRRKFTLVIVDEAQDTDAQQWAVLRRLFPVGEPSGHAVGAGALVAVGDPKQSIYRFRGADVEAYRVERDRGTTVTLTTNFRSDEPVLAGLNDLFDGATFGRGIVYRDVHAPAKHATSAISGLDPVEIVRVTGVTSQPGFAPAVARKVGACLSGTVTIGGDPVKPSDIAILVRSGPFGLVLQRRLRQMKIPAVCMGTDSVMYSESSEHWRVLLTALERHGDLGRVRHVLSTPLFGADLTSSLVFDDTYLAGIQTKLAEWVNTLRRSGVAALAGEILSDSAIVTSLGAGALGERRLTDFTHIADVLNSHTGARGCSATEALEALGSLGSVDPMSELVSRRVESDESAVRIMTVHAAKGLQFPIVIVADLWKPEHPKSATVAPVFRMQNGDRVGDESRVLDLGWILDRPSATSLRERGREESEEFARQLYVAVTRAEHHVCVLHATDVDGSVLGSVFDAGALAGGKPTVSVVDAGSLPFFDADKFRTSGARVGADVLAVAPLPRTVDQTYRRTSFTAIADLHGEREMRHSDTDSVGGVDEGERVTVRHVGYAADSVPAGVPEMHLARIPGGIHVGKVLHDVYERIDPAHLALENHVAEVVRRRVPARLRAGRESALVRGIVANLRTPLGGPLGEVTLCDIGSVGRRAEMNFEMSLPHLRTGLTVRHIGRVLVDMLPTDDILAPYARGLADESFDIPLAGLVNGSIDALLRVTASDGGTRLFVSDYKTNRLDRDGDPTLIEGYSAARMVEEMVHHHYPLQALLYGTAVHRFVRWRAPNVDADVAVGGIAYLFVRAMAGVDTPVDADGRRFGVFTWEAPKGMWSRLSDLLAGDLP